MNAPSWRSPSPTAWIVLAVLVAYLIFFRTTFLVPDSSGTYTWCRSLLFDRDVEFTNELARLGSVDRSGRILFHETTDAGRPGNPFGMGSGVLWAPFVLAAEAALGAAGASAAEPGYSDLHVLAASTGTVIYGLATLLLAFAAARRFVGDGVALWATVAAGFGTPFFAYLLHLPTYSHVTAAFGVALTLVAALRARERPDAARWLLGGAAAGLAALVRMQNAAVLAIPLALWLAEARTPRSGRRALRNLAALLGGFTVVAGWQLLAWRRLYGTSWTVPQGEGFLDLLRPQLLAVLFSPWHGLFTWAPVLLIAVPGLWLLWRRDASLAAGAALAWAGETWLAASVPDWWAGYAVGARRLVDLTPVFVLLLAVALDRPSRRWSRLAIPGIALAAVAWNLLLTLQVRTGLLSPFREVTLREILWGQARALARLPSYLWELVTFPPWPIHMVVHRDSPVSPALDPAPAWLIPVVLGLCWAVGLVLLGVSTRRRRGPEA